MEELHESDNDSFDTLSSSSGSTTYDISDNWPLHADCTFDFSDASGKEIWKLTPRSLKSQTALKIVQLGNPALLAPCEVPASIFPTLFTEACRLHSQDIISHLVSVWPFPILNLNDVVIPMDCYQGYFTKAAEGSTCLADVIIKGILMRKSSCNLKTIILPEDEAEGVALLKKFSLLPLYTLHLKSLDKREWIKSAENLTQIGAEDHIRSLTMPDIDISDCYTGASEEKAELSIIIPSAVIQWIGKNRNYKDVIIGLAMAKHAGFVYCFERIAICNMLDVKSVHGILHLISVPQAVKKLVFYHKHAMNNLDVTCNLHPLVRLAHLRTVLVKYIGLESFSSRSNGMYSTSQNHLNKIEMAIQTSEVFSHWTNLRELDLSGNPLTCMLESLLGSLKKPMVRLILSDTELGEEDLEYLSRSHHLETLHTLCLDFISLHKYLGIAIKVFRGLVSISTLRTRQCQLNYPDVVLLSASLEHSHTLKSWNLLHNPIGNAKDLKKLISHCSQIPGLREIGCKPTEVNAVFGAYHVHSGGPVPLSDDERRELKQLAEKFKIMVY